MKIKKHFFSHTIRGDYLILKIRIKYALFKSFLQTNKDIYFTFLALLIAIGFHELGQFSLATYYNLNPNIGISGAGVYILADSAPRYMEEIITNGGVIANLLIVFLLFIIFFLRERNCQSHTFPCYFILLVLLSNLLIALISLILFPFVLYL